MKSLRHFGLKVACVLTGVAFTLSAFAIQDVTPPQTPQPAPPPPDAAPAQGITAGHSAGVSDILKMLDAKVDLEVVKTYIKNSSIAYNPTAEDVVTLKQRGVPDEILTL